MARPKKEIETQPVTVDLTRININQFLCCFPLEKGIKSVFKNWYFKEDMSNPLKTKQEWINLYNKYRRETA